MKHSTLYCAFGLLIMVSVSTGCIHSDRKINYTPNEMMKEQIISETGTVSNFAYHSSKPTSAHLL